MLAALVLCGIAVADPVADDVARGNALVAEGKAKEALDVYALAAEKAGKGVPAELTFNRACAFLATEQIAEAESGFRAVIAQAGDDRLRAAAAYNLGLIEAKRAEGTKEDGAEDALGALRRAERLFRTAASANPEDATAARNVDLIQRRIAAMQEQQKKEEQQKKDGQKGQQQKGTPPNGQQQKGEEGGNRDLSDQLDNLAGEQEKASQQSGEMKKSEGKSQEQKAKEQSQASEQQSDISKQTSDAARQAQQQSQTAQDPKQKEGMDKAKESLDKAQQAQKEAEEKLKKGDAKGAEEAQKEAAKQLKEAAQQAKGAEEAKRQQEQQQQAQEQQGQQGEEGKEGKPFDLTAAQILEQEKKVKEAMSRQQRQRARPAAVPKDW